MKIIDNYFSLKQVFCLLKLVHFQRTKYLCLWKLKNYHVLILVELSKGKHRMRMRSFQNADLSQFIVTPNNFIFNVLLSAVKSTLHVSHDKQSSLFHLALQHSKSWQRNSLKFGAVYMVPGVTCSISSKLLPEHPKGNRNEMYYFFLVFISAELSIE